MQQQSCCVRGLKVGPVCLSHPHCLRYPHCFRRRRQAAAAQISLAEAAVGRAHSRMEYFQQFMEEHEMLVPSDLEAFSGGRSSTVESRDAEASLQHMDSARQMLESTVESAENSGSAVRC